MALTQRGNTRELIGRYNQSPSRYTDEEQRNLLQLALHYGMAYKPESKPISKGLYNFANTASFGLVPESWRPHSIGQDYYGESGIDKFAGGAGLVGGLIAAPFALMKGAKAGYAGMKGIGRAGASRFPRVAENARQARDKVGIAKDYIISSSPIQTARTRLAESKLHSIAKNIKDSAVNLGTAGANYSKLGMANLRNRTAGVRDRFGRKIVPNRQAPPTSTGSYPIPRLQSQNPIYTGGSVPYQYESGLLNDFSAQLRGQQSLF